MGLGSSRDWNDTDQAEILQAVIDRLIDRVEWLNQTTCVPSLDTDPPVTIQHDRFATVAPTAGQFDREAFDGGGRQQTWENAGVVVTVFTRVKLDPQGRDSQRLLNAVRGLFRLKHDVLDALSGHDLSNPSGELIVRNLLYPIDAGNPEHDRKEGLGRLSITFGVDFAWKLFDDQTADV